MSKQILKCFTNTLVAVLLLGGAAGCAPRVEREPNPVVSQDAFVERFDAVCDPGALIPLSELTTVQWDRVSLFPEGTPAEKYEAETGSKAVDWGVFGTRTPPETFMALQNSGEVVELIQFLPGIIYGNLDDPSFSYDADVLLRMTETDHGCYGELVPATSAQD